MKKLAVIIAVLVTIGALSWVAVFSWKNLRSSSVIPEPPEDITKIINETDMPLKIPPGFKMEIFAKNLPGARVMKFVPYGGMVVSQTSQGTVSYLERDEFSKVIRQQVILRGLKKPHGLAVRVSDLGEPFLYVAEEDKISRAPFGSYDEMKLQKLVDLPDNGHNFTRTIEFGPDGRLYVSIGSSCNVCYEKDERNAKIYSMNPDGSDFKEHARGLRNTVFFTWSYVDGKMWGTDMGRDLLGDDLPPDEINIIEKGEDYGWPLCYGKNVFDPTVHTNDHQYIVGHCTQIEIPSHIDIPAHSAPLGLAFIPEEGWPEDYWYDLLVAYHGSWNRSVPTGYKIVRFKLDAHGKYEGVEDFVSGWLTADGALGRPVDILVQPGGTVYISDDKAGVIYKMSRISEVEPGDKKEEQEFRTDKGKTDLIFVNTPERNESIQNPLVVKGEARGNWYFEASFPVRLFDANGKELAVAVAQAKGNWMTADFVPFEVTLRFSQPETETGTLVLEKDNASGLPEHDDALRIPIRFE